MNSRRLHVTEKHAGLPLQDFLATQLSLSRNRAKALLDNRLVFVNGRRVWMTQHTLRKGDALEVITAATPSQSKPAPIVLLYQDEHYAVANKPAGRLSNGADSVEADCRTQLALPGIRAVHRLDRDTTGCLLLAKSGEAFDRAVTLFKAHDFTKVYHTLVYGEVKERDRTIETPIDGEPAVTILHRISASETASHLKVKIETGRTHQIRRHMAYLGHPVLGDRTYAGRTIIPEPLRAIERQMLHAASLTFECPYTKKVIRAEAPLPKDFKRWMKRLGLR